MFIILQIKPRNLKSINLLYNHINQLYARNNIFNENQHFKKCNDKTGII